MKAVCEITLARMIECVYAAMKVSLHGRPAFTLEIIDEVIRIVYRMTLSMSERLVRSISAKVRRALMHMQYGGCVEECQNGMLRLSAWVLGCYAMMGDEILETSKLVQRTIRKGN